MSDSLQGYGGARQYLQALYTTKTSRMEFFEWVNAQIPALNTVEYVETYDALPSCQPGDEQSQMAFLLRIWAFSFQDDASLREAPGLSMSWDLYGHILVDGFVTATEPVYAKALVACHDFHGIVVHSLFSSTIRQ